MLPEQNRDQRGYCFYPTAAPRLYATENTPLAEKPVVAHYFVGACDWYVVEFDLISGVAFGYACLGDPALAEWGYIDLPELEAVRMPPGFVVDRDLYWAPCTFARINHNRPSGPAPGS